MLIGTLNPYEHGECYVTDDGAETLENVSFLLLTNYYRLLKEKRGISSPLKQKRMRNSGDYILFENETNTQ
jgi:hypothetical protein